VRIKICGLTRVDEALACAQAGADWIGLNFHPPSPRSISFEVAREIVGSLKDRERSSGPVGVVGLFVNRPPAEVAACADRLGLDSIQLHGDEPPEDLVALGERTIIRAFRLGGAADIARMTAYLQRARELGRLPDAVLIDAFVAGQPGGTGATIAGELLENLPSLPRLILAGGLTPTNVAERINLARPWMVDVASGVEASPGRKDPAQVRAFILAAREASRAGQAENRDPAQAADSLDSPS
jgi:phosphoribosylanthranilate isomerase